MAESVAKIRITADGQQVIQEAEKMRRSFKTVGEATRGWAGEMAKTMAFSGALLGTLRAITSEQERARDAAAQLGRNLEKAGSAEIALAKRYTATQSSAILAAARGGVRSEDEVSGFVSSLAKERGISAASAIGRARAFATGLAESDEVLARRGVSQAELDRRAGRLGPDAVNALAARRIRALQQQRQRAAIGSETGLAYGLAEEAEATRTAESPVASAIGGAANRVLSTVTFGFFDKQNAVATEQLQELRRVRASIVRPQTGARGE